MPDPYLAADVQHISGLQFDREAGNGARYWTTPSRHPAAQPKPQEYFYRAMKRAEGESWLRPGAGPDQLGPNIGQFGNILADGHQGWASFRDYSYGYLQTEAEYVFLLEVYAPDFLTKLASIGVKTGKAEAGDMSWGIGGTLSNGFKPDGTTNKTLKAEYFRLFRESCKGNQLKKGSKRLTPLLFKESIRSIGIVDFKSTR